MASSCRSDCDPHPRCRTSPSRSQRWSTTAKWTRHASSSLVERVIELLQRIDSDNHWLDGNPFALEQLDCAAEGSAARANHRDLVDDQRRELDRRLTVN